jgi:hypothetical protein
LPSVKAVEAPSPWVVHNRKKAVHYRKQVTYVTTQWPEKIEACCLNGRWFY